MNYEYVCCIFFRCVLSIIFSGVTGFLYLTLGRKLRTESSGDVLIGEKTNAVRWCHKK